MANCPHTSFNKGKRIIIILKNGDKFIDKYLGHKSGYIILKEKGRLKVNKIRSTGIYKPKNA